MRPLGLVHPCMLLLFNNLANVVEAHGIHSEAGKLHQLALESERQHSNMLVMKSRDARWITRGGTERPRSWIGELWRGRRKRWGCGTSMLDSENNLAN
jgi:hypothetical protein